MINRQTPHGLKFTDPRDNHKSIQPSADSHPRSGVAVQHRQRTAATTSFQHLKHKTQANANTSSDVWTRISNSGLRFTQQLEEETGVKPDSRKNGWRCTQSNRPLNCKNN